MSKGLKHTLRNVSTAPLPMSMSVVPKNVRWDIDAEVSMRKSIMPMFYYGDLTSIVDLIRYLTLSRSLGPFLSRFFLIIATLRDSCLGAAKIFSTMLKPTWLYLKRHDWLVAQTGPATEIKQNDSPTRRENIEKYCGIQRNERFCLNNFPAV